MKEVEYKGLTYHVPEWTNYIAADSDGCVYAYEEAPTWLSHTGVYTSSGQWIDVFPAIEAPELKQV